jgi:hypothetical protein
MGVVLDMNIMSPGGMNRCGTDLDRTEEIVLYREESTKGVTDRTIEAALTIVIPKSINIQYRVLMNTEIMPRWSE